MTKVIHETSGDKRWVDHTVYRLRADGDVDIESWREDDDWDSYGASRENEQLATVPVSSCPMHIRDRLSA